MGMHAGAQCAPEEEEEEEEEARNRRKDNSRLMSVDTRESR